MKAGAKALLSHKSNNKSAPALLDNIFAKEYKGGQKNVPLLSWQVW